MFVVSIAPMLREKETIVKQQNKMLFKKSKKKKNKNKKKKNVQAYCSSATNKQNVEQILGTGSEIIATRNTGDRRRKADDC